ncbi:MAG TPA: hypothetical protein VGX52_08855 [Burkholderiales bacterium]|nr:hypothetical protein [Burkholderiales bacterium]
MTRLVPLAVAAAVATTLGACTTPPPQGGPAAQQPPKIVTNVHPYKAGNGVVQSVSAAPVMAGAGSSAEPLQRLEIKMDNGSIQYVDTTSREFTRGTRVTLTEDRLIKRT